MRGFVLELKRVNPTAVRNMTVIEVEGVERFLADTIYIPEERRGLYSNVDQALKFANGRIIHDKLKNDFIDFASENHYKKEIEEKLELLKHMFET